MLTEARLSRAAGFLRSAIAKTFPDQFSALAEAAMVYAVVASERQFVRYGQMSALGSESGHVQRRNRCLLCATNGRWLRACYRPRRVQLPSRVVSSLRSGFKRSVCASF